MITRILLLFCFLNLSAPALAECVLAVQVNGAITAATMDYLARAEKEAQQKNCQSILLRMNTPGGELQATRSIVENILASSKPYFCLITPNGGHAGSAGAIILQACHVSGGLATTHLGAATPIMGTGQNLSEDLRQKVINDTVSWTESLAKTRNRNAQVAKDMVVDARSITADEAVKLKALDVAVKDEAEFLDFAAKKTKTEVGPLQEFQTDLRYQVLNFVADPELAYLMFMGSLGLLYLELTHPGLIAPGVIGGVGLVLSLIAFHKLDVQWGGFALMVLGIAFLVAELFITSFGVLGIGGLAALIMGSLFLFDPATSGYRLPLSLILTVSLGIGAFFLALGVLVLKTLKQSRKDLDAEMAGRIVKITSLESPQSGQVEIGGEIWRVESEDSLQVGDQVLILNRRGLILKVRKS